MSLTERAKVFRPVYKVIFGSMQDKWKNIVFEATNVLSISTDASIGSSAGKFEMVFDFTPDHKEIPDLLRWDEILIPNDYVEISLGRIGELQPQVVMRGWIDNIRVAESGGTGAPSLRIAINGRDYGKAWLVTRIINLFPPMTPEAYVLQYGIKLGETTVPDFFENVLDKIMHPYIAFHQRLCSFVSDYESDDSIVKPDKEKLRILIYPNFPALMEPVYSLLRAYQNAPWIEMFVRDDIDKPRFILRWSALRGPDGKMETPFGSYPAEPVLHNINSVDDIVELNIGKSDIDVFNYIRALSSQTGGQNQDQNVAFFTYGVLPYIIGGSIDRYGFKPFQPETNLISPGQGDLKPEIDTKIASLKDLVLAFTVWLSKMYGHNEMFYNGSVRIKGLPKYRIGDEVLIENKDTFYVEGVRHEFVYLQNYRTTLSLTRGMPKDGLGGDYTVVTPYGLPETFPHYSPKGDSSFFEEIIRQLKGDGG